MISQYLNLNCSHSKQISIWSQSHLSQLAFDILKENYRLLSCSPDICLPHLLMFVRQNFKWKFMRFFISKLRVFTCKFASSVKFSGAEYNTESQEIVITGRIIGISRGIWAGRVSYVELGKIGRCSLANWGTQTCNLMGLLSPTNEAEYLDWRAGCSLFQAGHQMSAVMVR